MASVVVLMFFMLGSSIDSSSSIGFKFKRNAEMVVNSQGDNILHRKALISPLYTGLPYENVQTLPGFIQAEFFDIGGQDIAYNNIESGVAMPPNVIRLEENGVAIAIQINDVAADTNPGASEETGAMAVGMGMAGEWMRYTINVPIGGTFTPTWRIATWDGADGPVAVNIKVTIGTGAEVDPCALDGGGNLNLAEVNTEGWKTFASFVGTDIDIEAGDHVLTICLDEILNFEINYIEFVLVDGVTLSPTAATTTLSDNIVVSLAPTIIAETSSPTASPSILVIEDEACISENLACNDDVPCCDLLSCSANKLCTNDDWLEASELSTDSALSASATVASGVATLLLGFYNY